MNSNEIRELELIEKIKLQDSEALKQLCNIYQPLIRSISNNYFFRIYDYQDWQQEAMIVCYSCAQSFSRERGSFAGYFRRRLTNHIISLIRKHWSLKSKINNSAASWEYISEFGVGEIECGISELIVPLGDLYTEIVEKLSNLELAALMIVLGQADEERVIMNLNIDKKVMQRAKSRMMNKFRDVLFE